MQKIFASIGQMLFPNLCVCCDGYLAHQEEMICDLCQYTLPRYESFASKDSHLAKKFWGRLNADFVTAFLSYKQNSVVKNILNQLKYKGNRDIGVHMGKMMAQELIKLNEIKDADYIIPIPLHAKKQNLRGYNQSTLLANGFSEVSSIPVNTADVVRVKHNSSQTRKGRYERFVNSKEIFKVVNPEALVGKKVILLDDVITTGATIEACGNAILEVEGVKLIVVSLAVTI